MPFVGVAEVLGKLIVQLSDEAFTEFDIAFEGAIARHDTRVLSMAVLQGVLAGRVDEPLNLVNVGNLAAERGITWRESCRPAAVDYLNLITVTAGDGDGEVCVAGTARPRRASRRSTSSYSEGAS